MFLVPNWIIILLIRLTCAQSHGDMKASYNYLNDI